MRRALLLSIPLPLLCGCAKDLPACDPSAVVDTSACLPRDVTVEPTAVNNALRAR